MSSSTAALSPFTGQRYELDGDHVYYLPPKMFSILEEPKPTFLVGTRGTGKTTLLKALSWDERLNNGFFRNQLSGEAFNKKYLGVYFKLPNLQLALLDRWLREHDDFDYAAVFAFYLDLCWLEAVAPAIEHLKAARVLTPLAVDEERFFEAFLRLFEGYTLDVSSGMPRDRSIKSALGVTHSLRNMLERFARRRADINDVLESLPIGQIGSFGRAVGTALTDTLDGGATKAVWSLRICMDEGEALTLRQQRVINSMLRLAEWPVFYIVAYVSRPLDVTSTFLPNQTLQIADRQIYMLDEISDKDFRVLAEGVVRARLRATGDSRSFRARSVLGSLNINALLLRILRLSEDEFASELLNRSWDSLTDSHAGEDQIPPIYETYLRMRRPEMAEGLTGRARRRQSSASVRKQMVAAYLSICAELSSRPIYASSDMVLQISDKCMRDFLRQMDAIFRRSDVDVGEFVESLVGVDVQHDGIREAAEAKIALFTERVVSQSAQANQFVDLLARATSEIQSHGRNGEQLRTPERGIFTYRTSSEMNPSVNEALIRVAADAGFLKLLPEESPRELRFRVHASLAPHYGFSYRGAYYPACVLSDRDIDGLRSATSDQDARRALSAIVARVTGRRTAREVDQPTLPDLEPTDDD